MPKSMDSKNKGDETPQRGNNPYLERGPAANGDFVAYAHRQKADNQKVFEEQINILQEIYAQPQNWDKLYKLHTFFPKFNNTTDNDLEATRKNFRTFYNAENILNRNHPEANKEGFTKKQVLEAFYEKYPTAFREAAILRKEYTLTGEIIIGNKRQSEFLSRVALLELRALGFSYGKMISDIEQKVRELKEALDGKNREKLTKGIQERITYAKSIEEESKKLIEIIELIQKNDTTSERDKPLADPRKQFKTWEAYGHDKLQTTTNPSDSTKIVRDDPANIFRHQVSWVALQIRRAINQGSNPNEIKSLEEQLEYLVAQEVKNRKVRHEQATLDEVGLRVRLLAY